MSSAKQNRSIARLIVGAMSIDGTLDKKERDKVAATLEEIGMGELIADVGAAIEDDTSDLNLFQECKTLLELLGEAKEQLAPLIFRVVADVVASDRFVSSREAAYLSALARRLEMPAPMARAVLKQIMAERRGRLEIAGSRIDAAINPPLKDLLSFQGAEQLVGQLDASSIQALADDAQAALAEGERVSHDELERALAILGLTPSAKLADAENVWKETIANLDLPKMANLGETYVSAAINRITRVNQAYKSILQFHQQRGLGGKR
jgi:hypothetical protein